MTKTEKPTGKIRSSQKLSIGMISLLLMAVFVFVFIEERQRGLAIAIGIPLSACIVYFTWLWLGDRNSMKKYKKYLKEIRKNAKATNSNYSFQPKLDSWVPSPSGTKDFVLLMAGLTFFATIAMFARRSRLGIIVFLLDVGLLAAYVWLENQESKLIEEEIDYIENLSPDFFSKGITEEKQ